MNIELLAQLVSVKWDMLEECTRHADWRQANELNKDQALNV